MNHTIIVKCTVGRETRSWHPTILLFVLPAPLFHLLFSWGELQSLVCRHSSFLWSQFLGHTAEARPCGAPWLMQNKTWMTRVGTNCVRMLQELIRDADGIFSLIQSHHIPVCFVSAFPSMPLRGSEKWSTTLVCFRRLLSFAFWFVWCFGFVVLFLERLSSRAGWPQTHHVPSYCVAEDGLETSDSPVSTS